MTCFATANMSNMEQFPGPLISNWFRTWLSSTFVYWHDAMSIWGSVALRTPNPKTSANPACQPSTTTVGKSHPEAKAIGTEGGCECVQSCAICSFSSSHLHHLPCFLFLRQFPWLVYDPSQRRRCADEGEAAAFVGRC